MNHYHHELKKIFRNLLLVVSLIGVIACSSKPVVHELPATAGPAEEIANLEKELTAAREKQVDVLSPTNFKEAQESLEAAKKKFLNGKDSKQTLHEVAVGKAYLTSANNAAEVARNNIESVVAAREAAIKANANSYFSSDFKKVDQEFKDVTEDIEKNKMNKIAKQRGKLQDKYLELEVRSIKEKHLRESRDIIAEAKRTNAEKYAPRTLAIAEKSLVDTEAYIKANPHETSEIEERARKTKEAATHALNINRIARGSAKVSSEEMAILVEQERKKATESEQKLGTVEDELATTQSALEREKEAQDTMAKSREELEAEKSKLEEEKSFNQKFELAREQFSSEEAEVYRQGDALLIRLKGMEFPSAASSIQSRNYPLLSKVKKIVEEFGSGAAVRVEGHTDSMGGRKINNKISSDRARAVKEYLEAHGGGIENKIEAVGYGDQKPLATNKTPDGRAQNRRVDIVIQPDSTKL